MPFDQVAGALQGLTGKLAAVAILVAGVGALAMAIIEALKAMLPRRAANNVHRLDRGVSGR